MVNLKKQIWSDLDTQSLPTEDSLLACLVLLTRYYHNPFSAQSLSARLPLEKNKLTPELLPRAAARAALECEAFTVDMMDLENSNLPAILILKDNEACILIVDENGEKKVIQTANVGELKDPAEIEPLYTGTTYIIHPEYKFTTRAEDTLGKERKNWFWKVMFKSWPMYTEVLVASLLINLFALVVPLFTMNVYDRVVPNRAIETMWVLASGVALVFIFDLILKTLRSYFIDHASKRTDKELSASIFQHILGISMDKRPKSVGAFANTVQSFEVFREFITSSSVTILVDLPFVFIYLLFIYFIGGILFIIPLLILPFVFLVGIGLQFPLIKLTKQSYQYAAEKQATLFESLANIETVKTTGAESVLQSRWEQLVELASKNSMKLKLVANTSINLSSLAQQLATIIMVLAGVYMITDGKLTTGGLIACTILAGRAVAPMAQISSLLTRYYQATNALRSLDKVMQLPADVDEKANFLHRPALKGKVEFRQVSFNYAEAKIGILKSLNFTIKSGEKVAVIGRVGSGKSTLARLILKLYIPSEGTILLDDTDYRQLNPDDLRQQVGYVPQDVVLFYGSVRQNITIGAPFVDDSSLLRAAEVAGVSQITDKHPDGYDRQVGEKGSELSGGQRQSVSIARALIRNPKLLIMDEPTSAMDDNSERIFKQNMTKFLTPEHTFILITHKVSMLELVDRLIVLDDGKVIADGPKEAVLTALRQGMSIKR